MGVCVCVEIYKSRNRMNDQKQSFCVELTINPSRWYGLKASITERKVSCCRFDSADACDIELVAWLVIFLQVYRVRVFNSIGGQSVVCWEALALVCLIYLWIYLLIWFGSGEASVWDVSNRWENERRLKLINVWPLTGFWFQSRLIWIEGLSGGWMQSFYWMVIERFELVGAFYWRCKTWAICDLMGMLAGERNR